MLVNLLFAYCGACRCLLSCVTSRAVVCVAQQAVVCVAQQDMEVE